MTLLCSFLRRLQHHHHQQQRLIFKRHDSVRWCSSCVFLLHSNQQNNISLRTTTAIHPLCSSTAAPRDIIYTVRPSTTTSSQPLVRYNSRFLSTRSDSDIQRYLSREAFPLGSFDFDAGQELVKAIQQWADKGTPEDVRLAFQLLDRLFEEAIFVTNKEGDDNPQSNKKSWQELFNPNDLVYKVVNAWRKSSSNSTANLSPRSVFEMVKQWEAGLTHFRSPVRTNNMIIHATVSSNEPELAEEILHYLLESDGRLHKSVNAVSFNSVIDVWAKSNQADAPQKAEALLKEMIKQSSEGWIEVTPDVITYNSVIATWANSKHDNAPYRVEELLREMLACGLAPDNQSYSSVLTTWARSNENHAADRAAAILQLMIKLYKEGNIKAKPNSYCYSAVISAYAGRGDAQKAEQLFADLNALYKLTKDRDFLLNNACCSAVINAWTKSGRLDAPDKAEGMLRKMQDLAISLGEPLLVPNVITFNSVLKAWAQSRDDRAPYRCEEILKRMEDLYEHGHAGVKPDVVSFSTVIDSWAKSRKQEAPERAEAILRHMQRLHDAGDKGVKPDIVSYNTVMNAWSHSTRHDTAERAQALCDEMQRMYLDGDVDMKPNARTFGTLITAWGRTACKDGAVRAQAVFDEMVARYEAGDKSLKPGVVHLTALISAWAKAGCVEKAELILREMESNKWDGVKPNIITYNAVMKGWSYSSLADAEDRMQSLYDEMKRKCEGGDCGLKPNAFVFDTLLSRFCRSRRQDVVLKAQAVFEDLVTRVRSGETELKYLAEKFHPVIKAMVKNGRYDPPYFLVVANQQTWQ